LDGETEIENILGN